MTFTRTILAILRLNYGHIKERVLMSAGTKMYVPMRSQNSVEQGIPYFVFYHRFVPNSGDEELILKTK